MSEKKKDNWFKKHKILTVIGALILLGIISSAAGGGDTSTTNQQADTKTETKKETVAKIGQPARDGKFEFIVKSVKCGKTRVGDQYVGTDAQGEFCMVNMTIENIGNEEQSLFVDNQYAYDSKGKRYSADSEASIYSSGSDGSSWYDEINPGNKVTGAVIFDVPKGTKLVSAELHDSMASGGIKVNLK